MSRTRIRIPTALLLGVLLLVPLGACGGGTGGIEEASDYLYSCLLDVTNGTANRIVQYEWVLVERKSSGDVVWGALGREPGELFDPGKQLDLVLGPNYADVADPSHLEWEVVFVDAADVRYGPWTVPLADCGGTTITVTPADAS